MKIEQNEISKINELEQAMNKEFIFQVKELIENLFFEKGIENLSEKVKEKVFNNIKIIEEIILEKQKNEKENIFVEYNKNDIGEFLAALSKINARINILSPYGKEIDNSIRKIVSCFQKISNSILIQTFNDMIKKERKLMVESKIKREIGESVLNPNNFVAINNFFTELHKQIYQDKILIESKDFNFDSFIELTKQKINHQNDLKCISEDLNDVLYYFNEMAEGVKLVANDILSKQESFNKYVLEDEKLNNNLLDKFKGMLKYHLIEILEQGKTVNKVYPKFEAKENYKNLFISFKNAILDIAEIDKKKYESNLLSKIEEQLDKKEYKEERLIRKQNK